MKILLTASIFAILPFFVYSQNKTSLFTELTSIVTPVDGGPTGVSFGLQFGFLHDINQEYKIGAGIGIIEPKEFETSPAISIFFRNKAYLTTVNKVNPFITLDLGYLANTEEIKYGSIYINPSLGVDIESYYLSVGYHGSIGTFDGAEWVNSINFTVGKSFYLKTNTAFASFLRKTKLGIDLSYDIAINESEITNFGIDYIQNGNFHLSNHNYMSNTNSNWSVALHWLYPITSRFNAGLGLGFCSSKLSYVEKDDSGVFEEYTNGIKLFIRGEYDLTDSGTIIPFAAANIGTSYGKHGLRIEPQAGVKIKNHWRLAVAYSYIGGYYSDQEGGHLLGFKLGYDF